MSTLLSHSISPSTITVDPKATHYFEGSHVCEAAIRVVSLSAPLGNVHQHLCSFHMNAYVV